MNFLTTTLFKLSFYTNLFKAKKQVVKIEYLQHHINVELHIYQLSRNYTGLYIYGGMRNFGRRNFCRGNFHHMEISPHAIFAAWKFCRIEFSPHGIFFTWKFHHMEISPREISLQIKKKNFIINFLFCFRIWRNCPAGLECKETAPQAAGLECEELTYSSRPAA